VKTYLDLRQTGNTRKIGKCA